MRAMEREREEDEEMGGSEQEIGISLIIISYKMLLRKN